MRKYQATELLGGSPMAAAEAIGITPQAYGQWPERLSARLADRVVAAMARRVFPAEVTAWLAGNVKPAFPRSPELATPAAQQEVT